MSGKVFFDSNILIYAWGPRNAPKASLARDLIAEAVAKTCGVVSYQVLQESLNVALKKFVPVVTADLAAGYMDEVVGALEIVPWSVALCKAALSTRDRYQFSWYDSLIVAAALEANCETLFTEDLQHGQSIETLTVVNPFLQGLGGSGEHPKRFEE